MMLAIDKAWLENYPLLKIFIDDINIGIGIMVYTPNTISSKISLLTEKCSFLDIVLPFSKWFVILKIKYDTSIIRVINAKLKSLEFSRLLYFILMSLQNPIVMNWIPIARK